MECKYNKGDRLECIKVIDISLGLSIGDIVTMDHQVAEDYIFIYTPNSPTVGRAAVSPNLELYFKKVEDIFEIGDTVQCLTDKYKMITKDFTYEIHALEDNNSIRLTKSKRYKYKEKYFKLITKAKPNSIPKEKEKEIPVAKVHNRSPFKFAKERPHWSEIYSKIKKTYTTSVEEFNPNDVVTLLFMYMSSGDWENNRVGLNSTPLRQLLKAIATSHGYKDQLHNTILKHKEFFNNEFNIPIEVYSVIVAVNMGENQFSRVFGDDCKQQTSHFDTSDNGLIWKIRNRELILVNFSNYVKLNKGSTSCEVTSKNEMERIIYESILKGFTTIPTFKLYKEEEHPFE